MSSPRALLQAAVIRLQSRLGSGFADALAEVVNQAEAVGSRLHQELELFWEEVQAEADRIDNNGEACPSCKDAPAPDAATPEATADDASAAGDASHGGSADHSTSGGRGTAGRPVTMADVQNTVDALRADVADLSQRLEQSSR